MLKSNSLDQLNSGKKPFLDHLEDLRNSLIKILITVVVTTIISFIFASKLLFILRLPLTLMLKSIGQSGMEKEILRSLDPTGAFTLSLKISFYAGLALASPFFFYFVLQFVAPALTAREKKYIIPAIFWGGALFLLGVLFCYWIALPQSLNFFWRYNEMMGILPLWTIENYISFALFFILAFGLTFETPLIVLTLVKFGVLSPQTLRHYRRHAIVIIFIIAAVMTPPDAFSQVLLAIPMLVLYELCIWIASWGKPKPQ